jgi:excisionase family DNA binding protein
VDGGSVPHGQTGEVILNLLTVGQAAQRACVSPSLIYEWCAAGALPHLRLGKPGKRGCIRISPEDLDGYLTSCRVEGSPPEDDGPLVYIKK